MLRGDTHQDAKRDLARQEGDEEEQGQPSFFELLDAAVAALPCRENTQKEQRSNKHRSESASRDGRDNYNTAMHY